MDRKRRASNRLLVLLLAGPLVTALACRPRDPERSVPTDDAAGQRPPTPSVQHFWEVVQLEGQPSGYVHTQRMLHEAGEPIAETVESVTQLSVQRFGQVTQQTVSWISRVDGGGQLIDFEAQMDDGGERTRVTGRMVPAPGNDAAGARILRVERNPGGQTSRVDFPVERPVGGLFGLQRELMHRPLEPGQRRQLTVVAPVLFAPIQVELRGQQWESVELLDQPRELLRIESVTHLPGSQQLKADLWMDRQGVLHKTRTVVGWTQETYLASQDSVRRQPEGAFDLSRWSLLPLTTPPGNLHQRSRVVYRLTADQVDLSQLIVQDGRQTLQRSGQQTWKLEISSQDQPAWGPDADVPDQNDRRPNALIQSDDPQVQQLARQVGGTDDPLQLAHQLERHVHQLVDQKEFSHMMASAAEVARSRQGDCTEHAVLLAALCRARGLPARVAIGLVYHQPSQAFAYHMWTEAWIEDRWVGLDATLGHGGIGPAHIKLAHSNLDEGAVYTSVLPLLRLLGRLKVEVEPGDGKNGEWR